MKSIFCLMFAAVIFEVYSHNVERRSISDEIDYNDPRLWPGVRARVTQRGLDIIARFATDLLMLQVKGLSIPDITASAAGSSIRIKDVRISEFPRPATSLQINGDRGLSFTVSQFDVVMDADFEMKVDLAFFTIKKSGSVKVRGNELDFQLVADIGRDSEGRVLLPNGISCGVYGSDLDIDFQGGLSGVFNFAFRAFRGQIKDAIKSQLCAKAEEEMNKQLMPVLETYPVTAVVENDYIIDYRLVRFPKFTSEFMEGHIKGAVFLKENTTEPGFWPPEIPEFLNHTERMVYAYVTDYVMNSGFTSAFKNGKLAINITEDMIPGEFKSFLSTSCGIATLCIGAVFPQLEEQFPNLKAEMDIFATKAPVAHFHGNVIELAAKGEAQFYVKPSGVRTNLFVINMTVAAQVGISVDGNRIVFDVISIDPAVDVKETQIGDLGGGLLFETALRIAMRQLVMPKVVELGREGIVIPSTANFNVTNAEIIQHSAENVFIMATDVAYSVPDHFEALLAELGVSM